MTASKFDCAMSRFCDFVNNDVKKSSVEFHNFGKATDRLDVLKKKAKELNFVLKLIFTVSQ